MGKVEGYQSRDYAEYIFTTNSCKNILDNDLIVANYGSLYQTQGGGSNTKEDSVHHFIESFIKQLISKKSLNCYLKFMKIDKVTPDTLFPVALIFGDDNFKKCVKHLKQLRDEDSNIQVITANMINDYIKHSDNLTISLHLNTLVPISFLMSIHKSYSQKISQKGGNLSRLFIGQNVPPGSMQLLHRYWNGQSVPNNIYAPLDSCAQSSRELSFMNNELQNIPSKNTTLNGSQNYGLQVEVPSIQTNQDGIFAETDMVVGEEGASFNDSLDLSGITIDNTMA